MTTTGKENYDSDLNIHDAVRKVLQEEKEIESRKLNLLIQALPESKVETYEGKKRADLEDVNEMINKKFNCNVKIEDCTRLGRTFEGRTKPRPVRISVPDFETKRNILEAARKLKNDVKYSNVYISPDLTKSKRQSAYELRQEKRSREQNGETDLIIRPGKVINVYK